MDAGDFIAQLGRVVALGRTALGISTQDFADKIDKSVDYVEKLERGEIDASISTILSCARSLELSVAELLNVIECNHRLIVFEDDAVDDNVIAIGRYVS